MALHPKCIRILHRTSRIQQYEIHAACVIRHFKSCNTVYHRQDQKALLWDVVNSASFLAEISVSSTRYFFYYLKKYFLDQSIQKSLLFNLEKGSTGCEMNTLYSVLVENAAKYYRHQYLCFSKYYLWRLQKLLGTCGCCGLAGYSKILWMKSLYTLHVLQRCTPVLLHAETLLNLTAKYWATTLWLTEWHMSLSMRKNQPTWQWTYVLVARLGTLSTRCSLSSTIIDSFWSQKHRCGSRPGQFYHTSGVWT